MANNKSIQFLRGDSTKRVASNENLLPGQPFYETDTNRLYIGGASGTALKTATAINRPAEVYRGYMMANRDNYKTSLAVPEKNHSLVFFIQFFPISTSGGGILELLPYDRSGTNIAPSYALGNRTLLTKEGLRVVVLTTNSDGELIIQRDTTNINVGSNYTNLQLNITETGSEASVVGFSLD